MTRKKYPKKNIRKALPFITPKQLAERWQCSRSTVDRIARREGFTRLCLSDKDKGAIRYKRKEVIEYEKNRQVAMNK